MKIQSSCFKQEANQRETHKILISIQRKTRTSKNGLRQNMPHLIQEVKIRARRFTTLEIFS